MPVALKIETCLAGPVNEKTGRGGGFPESESLQTLDIIPGGFEIR